MAALDAASSTIQSTRDDLTAQLASKADAHAVKDRYKATEAAFNEFNKVLESRVDVADMNVCLEEINARLDRHVSFARSLSGLSVDFSLCLPSANLSCPSPTNLN